MDSANFIRERTQYSDEISDAFSHFYVGDRVQKLINSKVYLILIIYEEL